MMWIKSSITPQAHCNKEMRAMKINRLIDVLIISIKELTFTAEGRSSSFR
jgi:hypothetical protein